MRLRAALLIVFSSVITGLVAVIHDLRPNASKSKKAVDGRQAEVVKLSKRLLDMYGDKQ